MMHCPLAPIFLNLESRSSAVIYKGRGRGRTWLFSGGLSDPLHDEAQVGTMWTWQQCSPACSGTSHSVLEHVQLWHADLRPKASGQDLQPSVTFPFKDSEKNLVNLHAKFFLCGALSNYSLSSWVVRHVVKDRLFVPLVVDVGAAFSPKRWILASLKQTPATS